ncbi:MAG: hypothetical protein LBV73_20550 [Paraburkholderia sp.]|nr:hypothetical protein [Paraburkholderia sp.]
MLLIDSLPSNSPRTDSVRNLNIHLNACDCADDARPIRPGATSKQHMMRVMRVFGATDALEYGATIGATIIAFLFQKAVAMQENPVGSTILPAA